MRLFITIFLLAAPCLAQERILNPRYGFEVNFAFYPQKTPQEAIASITKAIDNKRIDYMLAHLADPVFVDETVAGYKNSIVKGGEKAKEFLAFDRLINETSQYFLDDP